ncbi:hypothetical protein CBS101457_005265 [Exobasidium rhododendri]|nr:hypothetical protein CBS101457_005265 [Exobasidium rhododendri]
MHVIFLTIPSSGEANVQLATAQALIDGGHQVTFVSGASFSKSTARLQDTQSSEKKRLAINFISLGSHRSVEDFTPVVQDRIQHMRKVPGDYSSISTCIEIALVSPEEHIATALQVRNVILEQDPDMIVVDCLSPAMISGVRLTKRGWLLSIPCSPGLTALPGWFSPHPSAADRAGSWGTAFENLYLKLTEYRFCSTQPQMIARRNLMQKTFQLKSFGLSNDLTLLPPYWEDTDCLGGLHFNVAGLTDAPLQPHSMVFVGAGIIEEDVSEKHCAVLDFMDEAYERNESVVYINMGSMFIWTEADYSNCIQGLKAVYQSMRGQVRFIIKINKALVASRNFKMSNLPPYILQTHWIESQQAVYQHSALKVVVHHGGGNMFNEAVYYGIPQLILSQWLDTHELGQLATTFGFGLQSAKPPAIEEGDIHVKLIQLLGSEWTAFKSHANAWATRSKLGGGASAASKVIIAHAESQRLTRAFDQKRM